MSEDGIEIRTGSKAGMSHISKFNETLDALLQYAHEQFPAEAKECAMYENILNLARKANPRMVVELFMSKLTPFIEPIMMSDADYFMRMDLESIKMKIAIENGESNMDIEDSERYLFTKIKQLVENVADETLKKEVMTILQLLVMQGALVTKNRNQLDRINAFRETPLG